MSQTAAEYFLQHGHAPSAAGVLAIDYDGTLFKAEGLMDRPDPNPGAVSAMRRLHEAGYKLIVWTSRLDEGWLRREGLSRLDQVELIVGQLTKHGIPWDDLSGSKPPAERYVDDRAIPYRDNWREIADFIIMGEHDGA